MNQLKPIRNAAFAANACNLGAKWEHAQNNAQHF